MNRSAVRKFSNRIYLGNVWVRPLSGGSTLSGNAVSLNRGGVTIFSKRCLEAGQAVEVMLRGGGGRNSAADSTFQGQVTQLRVETEGNLLDIAFAHVLSNEEMQSLENQLGIKVRS